jgi:RNA-directed DNA polymerase
MRTLYIEDLASHDDPESCAVAREGGGEALTGVRAGSAIEPRNQGFRGADVVKRGGRQHRRSRYREWPADPARSKNRCMHGVSRRENREIPRSPVVVDDAPSWMVRGVADQHMSGREGNAEAVRPR